SAAAAVFYSFLFTVGELGRSDENILDALKRYTDSVHKDEFAGTVTLSGWSDPSAVCVLLVMFVCLAVLIYFLCIQALKYIDKTEIEKTMPAQQISAKKKEPFWRFFFIIMVCWMPYFSTAYPGVVTYDSVNQLQQVEGLIPLSNHHPLIHTFFIKLFYNIGKSVWGSANDGVGLSIFVQMCIMAFIYSYMIKTLYRAGIKLRYCYLAAVFFALPINAMYSVMLLKNSLYACSILLFSVVLFKIFVNKEKNVKTYLLFFCFALFMTLFRSNGRIAYIICLPFIFFFARKFEKNDKIKMFVAAVIPLVISFFVTNVVYTGLGFDTHDTLEGLHMPMQHIARVVVDCEDKLTESEKSDIKKYVCDDIEKIKSTYNCRFADPMKMLMRGNNKNESINNDKLGFMKLYLTLGIKHPVTYMKAELDATVGYYNPNMQYVYSIFYGVLDNDLDVYAKKSYRSKTYANMREFCETFRYIPLLGNLYSPASVFLVAEAVSIIIIYLKKYKHLMVLIPAFADYLT
ncbi:MAG: hypothetical protein IJ736_16810, partial [Firmicutes bacterium]|nr:hypothetical protein [Bacillota bacterium]